MSYTPTIVINKGQLRVKAHYIDTTLYEIFYNDEKYKVYEYIKEVNETYDCNIIGGIEITSCQPETSSFSRAVRNELELMGIEFCTLNN